MYNNLKILIIFSMDNFYQNIVILSNNFYFNILSINLLILFLHSKICNLKIKNLNLLINY